MFVLDFKRDSVKNSENIHLRFRYLENSGCVGMCVNMCKIPTQNFFTNEFGLPLTMNPSKTDIVLVLLNAKLCSFLFLFF